MDKLRRVFSGDEDEEERGIMTEFSDGISLSWSTRIKGFIICFVLGAVLSLLGNFFLFLPNGLTLFAIFYTIGNVLSLASTCFLMGPVNQCKKMFAETRWIATIIVFIFMILTIMSAVWWKISILCIVFCVCQFVALTWYSLSYIPYARNAVRGCLSSMC